MCGVLPIEDINQRIPDGSTDKAPNSMRHSIPVGKADIIARELPEDLTGENMNEDQDLETRGERNAQALL